MNKDTSLEARFEGYPVEEYGVAPIPNLLFKHYYNLGLNDGQFTLLCHIISRKWTKEAPYPTITHIPMSTNIDTRRRYVREMRKQGLVFTARLYWTHKDAEENPRAKPGKLRSNLWYLGSLLHNLERMEQWLSKGNKASDFVVEIPKATVELYLDGQLNDVPGEIAEIIDQQTRTVGRAVPVLICSLSEILLCEKRIVDINDDLLCENQVLEKQVLENRIDMNKNHDSNKNQGIKEKEVEINFNLPPHAHSDLQGKLVYWQKDNTLHQAVVTKVMDKTLAITMVATGEQRRCKPEGQIFYLNGGPGLSPVKVMEIDSTPRLTPEQLAIKNAMIDLMPSADFVKQDKHVEIRRMKEIQESAIKAAEKWQADDFVKFGEWYHQVLWGDKDSPPAITLETIRKNWHTFIEYQKNGGKNGQAAVKNGQSKTNSKTQKTPRGNGRGRGQPLWDIPPTPVPDV